MLGFQLGLFNRKIDNKRKKQFFNMRSAHHSGEILTKSNSRQQLRILSYRAFLAKNKKFVEKGQDKVKQF